MTHLKVASELWSDGVGLAAATRDDVVEPVADVHVVWALRQVVFCRTLRRGDQRPSLTLVRPILGEQFVRLTPPRHCSIVTHGVEQVLADLETRRSTGMVVGTGLAAHHDLVRRQGVCARGAVVCPIDDRRAVMLGDIWKLLDLTKSAVEAFGKTVGDVHFAKRVALDRCPFGGPHEISSLIDPHRHRDVDEAEQCTCDVSRVDQAWVRGRRSVDPWVGMFGIDIERNGDDGEAKWFEFSMKRLPPGQAGATASITTPRDQQHLATVQRTEPEWVATAIDQLWV